MNPVSGVDEIKLTFSLKEANMRRMNSYSNLLKGILKRIASNLKDKACKKEKMNNIKFIFCLSGICLIAVSNNTGFAKSSLHIQSNENKINKTRSGLPVVQFYENILALYLGARLAYSTSQLPTSLFAFLTGSSQKNISKTSIKFLEDMITNYLLAVLSRQIPRSAEIEAMLINHILMINEEDDKIINSINRRIEQDTGVKIRIYSDLEMNDILNISTSTLIPLGAFEGLSSYPVCSIDSYPPELISYIYENGIHNLKKCIDFLNKMKSSDIFFNVFEYYAYRMNFF